MQLVDSDWPANVLAESHFRAQETQAPDGVCALARARLGTRPYIGEAERVDDETVARAI